MAAYFSVGHAKTPVQCVNSQLRLVLFTGNALMDFVAHRRIGQMIIEIVDVHQIWTLLINTVRTIWTAILILIVGIVEIVEIETESVPCVFRDNVAFVEIPEIQMEIMEIRTINVVEMKF